MTDLSERRSMPSPSGPSLRVLRISISCNTTLQTRQPLPRPAFPASPYGQPCLQDHLPLSLEEQNISSALLPSSRTAAQIIAFSSGHSQTPVLLMLAARRPLPAPSSTRRATPSPDLPVSRV